MSSLNDLLQSGLLTAGQKLFQKNASPGVQNFARTGADIFNQIQLGNAEQDRISQINQGFNQATGRIQDFGNRALDAVTRGAETANQSITDATGRATAAQQPFFDEGLTTLAEFRSILDNPNQILDEPGVRFQFEQGEEAVNRALEKNSLLNSSARLNAVTEFGQGLASTALDQSLNRRLPLIQAGQGAANNISSVEAAAGTNLANVATQTGRSIADINTQIGSDTANLALGQNSILANRDLADAIKTSGLTDILFGGGGAAAAGGALSEAGGFGEGTLGSLFGSEFGGVSGLSDTFTGLFTGSSGVSDVANSVAGLFGGDGTGFSLSGSGLNPLGDQASQLAQQNLGFEGATDLTTEALGANPLVNNLAVGGLAGAGVGAIIAGLTGGDVAGGVSQGAGAGAGAAIGSALAPGVGTIIGGFLGGTIGGKIGKAIGFSGRGGGEDKADYSIVNAGEGQSFGSGIQSSGVWGTVGLGHQKHIRNTDAFQRATEAVTESDKIMSALFTPEQNESIKTEIQNSGNIGSNSNEGGFSPARMMNTIFTQRANAIRRAVGNDVFSQLNIGPMYAALASGNQSQINQAFASLSVNQNAG